MRLKVSKSKNAASLYVIKSIYDSRTQSNTSVIVEKLGTEKELREKLNGADPYEWAREYIKKLNQEERETFLCELKEFLLNSSNPIPQFVIKKKQPKISKIKQEDPRKKQALEMLKRGMNYCEVGREFKVSDNTIRKWIKIHFLLYF